ncbi:unnamed protein product [Protopolystoma xenopodis]|uniref:Uncharacterized protein n=1 Tax=Protopolystoma xenopodis TaxID=117903 RepID=A0A3S5CV54_9PLAT|nr:unnamed protein product [Protopolystoma xenopodis]
MLPRSDHVRHMTHESLVPLDRNRMRLARKQRQHECSSKANQQLFERNLPSSSGRIELRISSPHTFTRNSALDPLDVEVVCEEASNLSSVIVQKGPPRGLTEECVYEEDVLFACEP